ncbi:hypothetical protein DPMN_013082 [Dreissena polymorpha]|uniref:Uncharacterized protein n=1 Tax=Dreissena polymorpha TaxID=45954 RepID=A0A9D4S230_DREPO|nr:hypothetical protein DPMN_013082 [Dreissena polymorpha]
MELAFATTDGLPSPGILSSRQANVTTSTVPSSAESIQIHHSDVLQDTAYLIQQLNPLLLLGRPGFISKPAMPLPDRNEDHDLTFNQAQHISGKQFIT